MSIIADMREWRARNPEADPVTVGGEELDAMLTVDWRVLGGVIPGPIPVEWVRVGDTIRDHGFEGAVTAVRAAGGLVGIESGHVSLVKVAQQDFITVLSTTNHPNVSAER